MPAFDVMTRGNALDSALQARDHLVTCGVPSALAAKDPRLWGRGNVEPGRLGWLDLPFASRMLLERLGDLVAELRHSGLDHVALVGVGAEGLAARAVLEAADPGRAASGALTVLDGGGRQALQTVLQRLDRTLVVLSSKAGVSIEGDAYHRILSGAFREIGLSDRQIAERFLVITDHDSPLHGFARHRGYRIGLTDPALPGHFGALSAYGLVPAALAGAQVSTLLEEAAAVVPSLGKDDDNPALLLGAVLGGCARQVPAWACRDKVALEGGPAALAGWVGQLLATGTGKRGRGIVPLPAAGRPAGQAPDLHSVALGGAFQEADTFVWGPPGAQFLLWEYATAVAAWLLGVDPFDEAAALVREAEEEAAAILRRSPALPPLLEEPDFVDGGIEVRGDPALAGAAVPTDLPAAIEAMLQGIPATGYLAVISYLPDELPGARLAPALAHRSGRPVCHGTGPSYLHDTGSLHKQGPRNGVFLVVTGTPGADLPVPGRPYSLGGLHLARALADVRALRRRGLPVLWLHLREPADGAARLAEAGRGRR